MIAPSVSAPESIDYAPKFPGEVKTKNFYIWLDYQAFIVSRSLEPDVFSVYFSYVLGLSKIEIQNSNLSKWEC